MKILDLPKQINTKETTFIFRGEAFICPNLFKEKYLNESVNELREKKQLLTEHLSVIIYESEKKKQEKLKELMLALDLGDVTNEEAEKAWKGFDVEDNNDDDI